MWPPWVGEGPARLNSEIHIEAPADRERKVADRQIAGTEGTDRRTGETEGADPRTEDAEGYGRSWDNALRRDRAHEEPFHHPGRPRRVPDGIQWTAPTTTRRIQLSRRGGGRGLSALKFSRHVPANVLPQEALSVPSVFLSYSHKDEDWKKRLRTHLGVLEIRGTRRLGYEDL